MPKLWSPPITSNLTAPAVIAAWRYSTDAAQYGCCQETMSRMRHPECGSAPKSLEATAETITN